MAMILALLLLHQGLDSGTASSPASPRCWPSSGRRFGGRANHLAAAPDGKWPSRTSSEPRLTAKSSRANWKSGRGRRPSSTHYSLPTPILDSILVTY
jgi:hypothetical protein